MTQVNEIATEFVLPNYHNELIRVTPQDTPVLSAIGGAMGAGGAEVTYGRELEWSEEELRAPSAHRQRLHAARTPDPEHTDRSPVKNIIEIHLEAIDVGYEKRADTAHFAADAAAINGPNAVADELAHQTEIMLTNMARDMEYSITRGVYNKAANNATQFDRTAGILSAAYHKTNVGDSLGTFTVDATANTIGIATHGLTSGDAVTFRSGDGVLPAPLDEGELYYALVTDAGNFQLARTPGGAAIDLTDTGTADATRVALTPVVPTTDGLEELMQSVWESGGIAEEGMATLVVNGSMKRWLTAAYVTDKGYTEETRNIGGVSVDTIVTNFGRLNVMLNRHFPKAAIGVFSFEQFRLVHRVIPGKGVVFVEPTAKQGASDPYQGYGTVGLKWGNSRAHGVLYGVTRA